MKLNFHGMETPNLENLRNYLNLKMDVSVCIVSLNSIKQLRKCLESLDAELSHYHTKL